MPAEWVSALLSMLVPATERNAWRNARMRQLASLAVLIDRGELPLSA